MGPDSGKVRGRFAPSPTGEMHLGNASTALLAWLSVRSRGGTFVMRMEDLDARRVRPGLAEQALGDLAWLGIDWDEGPDRGGPLGPYDQGARTARYEAAFSRLRDAGALYPCFCTRKDITAAASAPQQPGEERRYPMTCRRLETEAARRRVAGGERHAWRFRVGLEARVSFEDLVLGRQGGQRRPGDFVVARSDGVPAYQLAVVVDDVEMRITEVVRGADLLSSTEWQILLYQALGQRPPAFGHVPLLLDRQRVRLSKRQRGITLRELRDDGWTPERIVGHLAHTVGLRSAPEPVAASALVDGFSLSDLGPADGGLIVDPSDWG